MLRYLKSKIGACFLYCVNPIHELPTILSVIELFVFTLLQDIELQRREELQKRLAEEAERKKRKKRKINL